jgi:hypothetical protein
VHTKVPELGVHVGIQKYVGGLEVSVDDGASLAAPVALVDREHQLDKYFPNECLVERFPAERAIKADFNK